MRDPIRILALWALLHESADEGWKAAVARGRGMPPDAGEDAGADDVVDGLAALVDDAKERLKRELWTSEASEGEGTDERVLARLDDLAFEVAELRGRMESLQASIDALRAGPTS